MDMRLNGKPDNGIQPPFDDSLGIAGLYVLVDGG